MKRIILILALAAACRAEFRLQDEFIADDWSKYHVIGGAVSYYAFRGTAHPWLYSLGTAVAWEVGDAFKPTKNRYHDWRDHVLVADGFSYSDVVYHAAGSYLTWLILDATDDRVLFIPRYEP